MKTDTTLQQDVSAELRWEPSVQAARIGVEVKDGIVTLAGEVDSYFEKWNAERAALRVSGVTALATELKVHLPSLSQRTDADIAASVDNALEWAYSLAVGRQIKVSVENGWVRLSGHVDWQFQKQMASDIVRPLMGVVGVNNEISIKPTGPAMLVESEIQAALERTSIADAGKISVAVHGTDVTLSGQVQSWADRETATNAAWGTPGVTNVVDMLTLAH